MLTSHLYPQVPYWNKKTAEIQNKHSSSTVHAWAEATTPNKNNNNNNKQQQQQQQR